MQPHRCVGRERFRESMANVPRETVDALFDCQGYKERGAWDGTARGVESGRFPKGCWRGETKDEDGVSVCGGRGANDGEMGSWGRLAEAPCAPAAQQETTNTFKGIHTAVSIMDALPKGSPLHQRKGTVLGGACIILTFADFVALSRREILRVLTRTCVDARPSLWRVRPHRR